MKTLVVACFSLVIGLTSFVSFATAQEALSKILSGGVLNGKAIMLPKPSYPPAARAVGASGAVSVQVLIDEDGNVVSATAVSGHPLLRAAAVEAARGAKFSPTRLQGIPVKVAGVITYNFVGVMHLARVAFVLSHAERTSSFGAYSAAESFADQLPGDWKEEKEILGSLTFEPEEIPKVAEKIEEKKTRKETKENFSVQPPPNVDTKNRYTVKGDMNFSAAGSAINAVRKLDSKSLASVAKVSNLVEVRASASGSAAWTYELGRSLGVFVAEIDDQNRFQSNLAEIESLSGRAPAGVVSYSLQLVKEFVEFCKKENFREDSRKEIVAKAESLSNLRY